jgi:type VI secretion system secreted protein VgrG
VTKGDVPVAADDTLHVDPAVGGSWNLLADKGSGVDDRGLRRPSSCHSAVSLGGSVTDNTPGSAVSLAGGTLAVGADGSWSLTGVGLSVGVHTFEYRIENEFGSSDGTVTVRTDVAPVAHDDAISSKLAQTTSLGVGALSADNGSGVDHLGVPTATLVSFGGGSFGGSVTDNAAGSTVAIPVFGGTLSVNADGSVVVANPTLSGISTFSYRIENASGFSDATVTVTIQAPPQP